jgi:DNA methylase
VTTIYHVGDTRTVTADIPDGSVSLVASSPPFIALRSYLPADHPDKAAEIGSEPDPATFIDTLLALTAEWGRVLAPWGSIAIELGDTYAGSGGAGGFDDPLERREARSGYGGAADRVDALKPGTRSRMASGANWPRPKCLALVPQAYALSLAYGRNVLTGQPSPAGQWLVRNQIVWHRPNPAVGALGDKFRPSTSYITVATRSAKRWFDLTAVRTPFSPNTNQSPVLTTCGADARAAQGGRPRIGPQINTHAGAPPLDAWFGTDDQHDTWTITTQPSRLAHYAMWPPKLAERLILSMCPAQVCAVCGEPRRRVEEHLGRRRFKDPMPPEEFGDWLRDTMDKAHETAETLAEKIGVTRWMVQHWRGETPTPQLPSVKRWEQLDSLLSFDWYVRDRLTVVDANYQTPDRGNREVAERLSGGPMSGDRPKVVATGWTDCGHDNYAPGVVLDPFAGTGTTLAVADLHGRDAIGIDLDTRNRDLYPARLDECRRALFGTTPELPGQEALFT